MFLSGGDCVRWDFVQGGFCPGLHNDMRIRRCHWPHTPLARQHVIAFFYYFFDSNDLLSSLYLIDTSVITYNQAGIQIKIVNAERMNKLLIDKPDLNPQGNNYSVIRPVDHR